MRSSYGYIHRQPNCNITTLLLGIMTRSKNKLHSKSLGKNPSYGDIYRVLKSPRSFDPFMGMQLGDVRLPPSFSFNKNKLKIEESLGDNPLARFKTMKWTLSIKHNQSLILNPICKQLFWWSTECCPTNSYNSSNTVIRSRWERSVKKYSSHEVNTRLLTNQLSSIPPLVHAFWFVPIFTHGQVLSKY